jgi:hypothetical protein
MRNSAFFALAMLAGQTAHAASHSAPAACEPFAVVVEHHDFQIDNSRDTFTLARRIRDVGGGELMLGMTSVKSVIELLVNDPPQQGQACTRPRIEVFLRYQPMQVYIAREFRPATCPYDRVLAHEMQHVHAYRSHLPVVGETVRAALRQRFGDAIQIDSDTLLREVEQTWLPYIRRELDRINETQKAIDSDEEQTRLRGACAGALATKLESSLRGLGFH